LTFVECRRIGVTLEEDRRRLNGRSIQDVFGKRQEHFATIAQPPPARALPFTFTLGFSSLFSFRPWFLSIQQGDRRLYPAILLYNSTHLRKGVLWQSMMGTLRSSCDVDLSILEVRVGGLQSQINFLNKSSTELARGAKPLIRMQGNQTMIDPPESGGDGKRASDKKTLSFSFDKSYWSAGPRDEPGYCSQQTMYEDLGVELLDHAFNGFNACILACASLWSLSSFHSPELPPRWTNWCAISFCCKCTRDCILISVKDPESHIGAHTPAKLMQIIPLTYSLQYDGM